MWDLGVQRYKIRSSYIKSVFVVFTNAMVLWSISELNAENLSIFEDAQFLTQIRDLLKIGISCMGLEKQLY